MRIAFRPNTTLITGPAKVVSAFILTPSEEQQANKELALINADYSEPSTNELMPEVLQVVLKGIIAESRNYVKSCMLGRVNIESVLVVKMSRRGRYLFLF